MPKISHIDACQAPAKADVQANIIQEQFIARAEPLLVDEMVHFYNGHDCAKLLPADLQKVRELQEANDRLQRQVCQLEKDIKNSNDALTLLAEKERCLIIIARNTGEILKTHIANEERLRRIAELEAENIKLKQEMGVQRDQFIDTHELHARSKHAADFFLTKQKIEQNADEIVDLTQ